jgi:uncharacterized protein YbaP (TraB family)
VVHIGVVAMRAFATICALAALAGCAAPEPQVGSGPALWVVKSSVATVYLFGTIHLLPVPVAWQTPAIQQALTNSREIWTETDIGDAAAVGAAMRVHGMSANYDLRAALGPDGWTKMATLLTNCSVPPSNALHWRPWFAAMGVQYCSMKTALHGQAPGIAGAATPDRFLVELAKTENKQLRYLEPVADQVELLASRPDAEAVAVLETALNAKPPQAADTEKLKRAAQQIIAQEAAWARGEVPLVAAILADQLKGQDPAVYWAVFTNRNQHFANSIAATLRRPTVAFVAMGAGHLVGPDNVLDDLARQGITARRVE